MWLTLGLASAHVPNIASYTLTETDSAWQLTAVLPTSGMHHALKPLHPGEKLSDVPVETYESYLIDALTRGITLHFDTVEVSLRDPEVSLGRHETRVQFTVPVPDEPLVVGAHIDALSGASQNNVFRVKTPEHRARVVLSARNDFSGELSLR